MPQTFDERYDAKTAELLEGQNPRETRRFALEDMARLAALEQLLIFNVDQGILKLPGQNADIAYRRPRDEEENGIPTRIDGGPGCRTNNIL